MGDVEVLLGGDGLLGMVIVHRIVERPEPPGLHIEIPIGHADGFEREFQDVYKRQR